MNEKVFLHQAVWGFINAGFGAYKISSKDVWDFHDYTLVHLALLGKATCVFLNLDLSWKGWLQLFFSVSATVWLLCVLVAAIVLIKTSQ